MAASGKKLYALRESKKFSFKLPLSEKITIGNREYVIDIKEDDKYGTYVFWKNRRYPVEIIQNKQNKYDILFNDVSYSFTIETPFSLQRKKFLEKGKGKSDKEIITAPMPGRIVDVLVKEGNNISQGEPILILEAMKMQNEIKSSVSGKIVAVNVRPNINVNKDDILVEIKIA